MKSTVNLCLLVIVVCTGDVDGKGTVKKFKDDDASTERFLEARKRLLNQTLIDEILEAPFNSETIRGVSDVSKIFPVGK